MNAESERKKARCFLIALIVTALLINLQFAGGCRVPELTREDRSYSTPQRNVETVSKAVPQNAADHAAAARKKAEAEAAEAEHREFLARYLNPGEHSRNSGSKAIAIAAVSEDGRFNRKR